MKCLKTEKCRLDFFMGANAPLGFVSLYDELKIPKEGFRSYLIKGGAGTGKSGIMQKVATASKEERILERLHCSSDPNSLDGIILHTARCSMVDATPPHVIEPSFPGSFETVVNLCEYLNEEKLAPRLAKSIALQADNNACHEKCRRFLRCADILLRDNILTGENHTDFEKLQAFTARLSKRLVPPTYSRESGIEHKRLLSAVTNQGIVFYQDTIKSICSRVWLIDDPLGSVSPYILETLKENIISAGYDLFCCYCPLSPGGKIEHLLIPELGLAFVTQNSFLQYEGNVEKVIHSDRFVDSAGLALRRNSIRFNRKAATAMFDAAVKILKDAKLIHDELEEQYTDAVDFTAVSAKSDYLASRITSRIK